MSIRISQGGRLFAIIAGLGGAAMIGGAFITWTTAVFVLPDLSRDVSELRGAERLTMFVLGLVVLAGAASFIALGSRRLRIAAGVVMVLAAAAGLAIVSALDAPSSAELPCTNPGPLCIEPVVSSGDGPALAAWGAVVVASYGVVALLRSGGEASAIPATERPAGAPSGAVQTSPPTTRRKARMSDASLLAWTVVAIVIAVVVGFFIVVWSICSDPIEWC